MFRRCLGGVAIAGLKEGDRKNGGEDHNPPPPGESVQAGDSPRLPRSLRAAERFRSLRDVFGAA